MMEILVAIIQAVAAVAPGLIAAWTGHATDAEAISTLRTLVDGLPVRGGDHGAWARELEARKRRIRGS